MRKATPVTALLAWCILAVTAQTMDVTYARPAAIKDRPSFVVKRNAYILSYNRETKTPNWVAWHLTKAHTYGNAQRAEESFMEDTIVSPRALLADYYNSRYDRGHMCPAGDNKWNATAMRQSFFLTNICPQNHNLNKYEWNDVEQLCRQWARKYGEIDVVCGPIFRQEATPRYIGKGKVRVPDAFFKVVLCRKGRGKAIAFVFDNIGKKQPVEQAVCSVDEVEELTGIDFFPALDDDVERRVEATSNLKDW